MIEFTKSYKTEDGLVFGTIEEAQKHEIKSLFKDFPIVDNPKWSVDGIVLRVIECKEQIVDALTMNPNSKPKARKINGGTKKRTSKTVITDAATDSNRTDVNTAP